MSLLSPGALARLPRRLYRRLGERRRRVEEERFRTGLRFDAGARELLLSPHWDDAVLDCFTLLDSERELNVVNVFSGVPAPGKLTLWDAITGATDSAVRARERLAEDAVALARAGREPVTWLTRAGERLRQRLARLPGSQERAGEDDIRTDTISGKLLAQRPRLLPSLRAEAA